MIFRLIPGNTLSENYTSGTCSNTTNIYTYLGTQIKMKTIQFYNDCEQHEVDLSISNTYFISSLFDADWICLYFYSLCKNDYEIWEIFSWMKQNLLESKYRCIITKSSKGILFEFFHIASIFFQQSTIVGTILKTVLDLDCFFKV